MGAGDKLDAYVRRMLGTAAPRRAETACARVPGTRQLRTYLTREADAWLAEESGRRLVAETGSRESRYKRGIVLEAVRRALDGTHPVPESTGDVSYQCLMTFARDRGWDDESPAASRVPMAMRADSDLCRRLAKEVLRRRVARMPFPTMSSYLLAAVYGAMLAEAAPASSTGDTRRRRPAEGHGQTMPTNSGKGGHRS